MKCPKCGHQQNDNLVECARCGVIISKVIDRERKQEDLKKQYRQISDKEIKKLARSKSHTLHPDAIGIIEEEIRQRNLSEVLIASMELPTNKSATSTDVPFYKAIKILGFIFLS